MARLVNTEDSYQGGREGQTRYVVISRPIVNRQTSGEHEVRVPFVYCADGSSAETLVMSEKEASDFIQAMVSECAFLVGINW